jgi:hypothetical protein
VHLRERLPVWARAPRLERDVRRAAQRLQLRDDAEDFVVGEAERRLVHRRHRRREPGHDEGGGLVERLRQVLDVAQPGDAGLGPIADARQIGEAQRPALADGVAGETDAFAVHDLAPDLGHVRGGHVAGQHGVLRRLHLLLRHHLADVGVEARGREHEAADADDVRDSHDSARRSKSGRSCRLEIQNTTPIRRKNRSTVADTTCVAKPSVGVKASGERSRMTP